MGKTTTSIKAIAGEKTKQGNKKTVRVITTKREIIRLVIAVMILFTTFLLPIPISATAASTNITIKDFVKLLVENIELEIDTTQEEPYISAAMTAGILQLGDFTDNTKAITRTDAAVLLNRADELLHGDTVEDTLLKFVLEKRISDINKIAKSKREAVAS